MGALKEILGQARSLLKLSYKENRVDPPVIRYIQLVGKTTDSFDNLEESDILLGQLLHHSDGERNWVALIELDHRLVPNFHKQGLVAPVVVLLTIRESEWYCVGGSGTGDVGVGQGGARTQVQRFPEWESVGDLIRGFSGNGRGGIIKQRLYAGQDLRPSRRVIHCMHKKL